MECIVARASLLPVKLAYCAYANQPVFAEIAGLKQRLFVRGIRSQERTVALRKRDGNFRTSIV
jgi:hypothetical protein